MAISEQQFARWAKAPSETEESKCKAAVERTTKAIRAKFGAGVRIFLQGSYKNRTNVKLDSDVDIVVCYTGVYFPDTLYLSDEQTKTFHALTSNSEYKFPQFKNEVEALLIGEFDYGEIERKENCLRVKGNGYRVQADVVPAFVHKRLRSEYPSDDHTEGIEFRTDKGVKVISFPEQHYDSGVQKNANTGMMYKPIVRILKNIRNDFVESGEMTLKDMPSFSIECLVWNVLPHTHFQHSTYGDATKAVIKQIWNDVQNAEKVKSYTEVSELLRLFPPPSKITP